MVKIRTKRGGGNTADNFQKGFCLAMVLASLASIAPFVLPSDFAAIRTTFFPACYVVFAAGTVVKYLLEKVERIRLLQARIGCSPVHNNNHTVCRWGAWNQKHLFNIR